jgi:hypothetical protein
MDTQKSARLTPKGRAAMVRSVVEGGLSKVTAAHRPHSLPSQTPGSRMCCCGGVTPAGDGLGVIGFDNATAVPIIGKRAAGPCTPSAKGLAAIRGFAFVQESVSISRLNSLVPVANCEAVP